MKTSAGFPITGFEWTYTGPISIFQQEGYQGQGISRTMFLTPVLADIPAELFAIKLSQSRKPELAGKPVFKYFSYRFVESEKFQTAAPENFTLQTPLEEIKAFMISKLTAMPNVETSLNIGLKGEFVPVKFADDTYNIYDNEEFPSDNAKLKGVPPYYLKGDTIMEVKLKGVTSPHGNEYFQSELSTSVVSGDALVRKGNKGKIWGEGEADSDGAVEHSTPVDPTNPWA